MRKMLAPVFALVIALSLAACGGNNDPDPSGSAPGSSQAQEEQPAGRRGKPAECHRVPFRRGRMESGGIRGIHEWCAGAGLPLYHHRSDREYGAELQERCFRRRICRLAAGALEYRI
jgi:predicted small lipoprotein YifL